MSLDTKGRFKTGLKCLSTFGSSEDFFKRGFTTADFIHEGKNAGSQGLIYNGSEQRNNLIRAFKQ